MSFLFTITFLFYYIFQMQFLLSWQSWSFRKHCLLLSLLKTVVSLNICIIVDLDNFFNHLIQKNRIYSIHFIVAEIFILKHTDPKNSWIVVYFISKQTKSFLHYTKTKSAYFTFDQYILHFKTDIICLSTGMQCFSISFWWSSGSHFSLTLSLKVSAHNKCSFSAFCFLVFINKYIKIANLLFVFFSLTKISCLTL